MQRNIIKMKSKTSKILLFLTILFVIFLITIFKPYNYTKIYQIDDFNIVESYYKDNNYYKFFIEFNNIKYSYIISNKYMSKRKIIDNINIYNNELETCILPVSDRVSFYPLCSKDDKIYSYNLSSIKDIYNYKEVNLINDNYNNIKINYLNNKNYLLYNYKGFELINNKKEIKLFEKDIYNLNMVYQLDNYVIIPDYNSNYYFDNFYIINIENGKTNEMPLENKISFDSVFLGDYKRNIYILDKKEEKEYKIDIDKLKIYETDFLILENNKLIKKNYKYIVNNNITFNKTNLYKYEIINNNLYQNIDNNYIKISNLDISRIIKEDNETVYYLTNDDLYMFNNTLGEVLLLTNFEWNFNNTNMIFISK